MTAGAIFIATIVAICLTKGLSLTSFIFQVVPMAVSAIYLGSEIITRIGQGSITTQFGLLVVGTIVVAAVTVFNRSVIVNNSTNTYEESK